MTCGIDFGTSNSVIYVHREGQAPFVLSEPTVLFFPDDTQTFASYYVGKSAVDAYIASGMKGRFFQSIKVLLSDADYVQTEIRSIFYHLVDLLAMVLTHLKQAAEAEVGPLHSVTLGRPVYFSTDSEADQLAQTRLHNAAMRAGFSEVQFQLEPIAAALAYESRLTQPKTVLVADFGGGTTDYTVMKLGPCHTQDRQQDILSIGGVYIGGDTLDARLMWHRLTPYFGRGSSFSELKKTFPMPHHFYHVICAWADIAKLKTKTFQLQLKEIYRGSNDPLAIQRLQALINHDLGFALFKAIEAAKQQLSFEDDVTITFERDCICVNHGVAIEQFTEFIQEDCQNIQIALTETLHRAGLTESDIDTVFLTGGTSLVRSIRHDFSNRFGEDKLNSDLDLFTSVAQGLAFTGRL
jgi:hypothetical chaperone protein